MSLPYHLIIFSLILLFAIIIVFVYRKKFLNTKLSKVFLVSTLVFLLSYFFIVSSSTCMDIYLSIKLQTFDLNGDGIFTGNEITKEQEKAMLAVISDTGRNFSVITGAIFSFLLFLIVFIVYGMYLLIKNKSI